MSESNPQKNDPSQQKIDAVITWVDGADPRHKKKLENYLAQVGGQRPRAASAARFHSAGEIEYCVVSLLKYAPWLGTIYIVSDEQQPDFMQKLIGTCYEQRVKIIDHRIIFAGFDDCLPSFSSMSIASLLWRIPGLSERFLFLNDDFSLLRPITPEVFYRANKVVLRGAWQVQTGQRLVKKMARLFNTVFGIKEKPQVDTRVRFIGVQENSARMLGFYNKVFSLEHNPHPWLKSEWQDFCEQNPQLLKQNIRYQLRSPMQFVPEGFSAHLLLSADKALIDNRLKTLQLKPGDQALVRIKAKIAQAERDERYVFVCIQSLESASPEAHRVVVDWLNQRIGSLEQLLAEGVSGQNNNL